MTNEEFEDAAKHIAETGLKAGSEEARDVFKKYIADYLQEFMLENTIIVYGFNNNEYRVIETRELEQEIDKLKK